MNIFSFKKLGEPILAKNLIILIVIVYFCWLFKTYSGNFHSVYLHMWKYTSGSFSFENDIFLERSNQPHLSILYSIFSFLKINPDNDYVGFLLHIFFSTISGIFLFKIIKKFGNTNDTNGTLVILFSILTIGTILLQSNIASWVIRTTGMPTYFGHSLIFPFLWVLLNQFTFFLFIISSLMLLIAVKATWFVVGIGIVYSILFIRPFGKNVWIAGPLVAAGYLSVAGHFPFDHESRLLFFENVLIRDEEEAAFHLQSKNHLILLIFSFPIYFFLLSKIKNYNFKNLSMVILVLSFLCFIFGFFYALYGSTIFPEPRILALNFPRALGIYQLFFWLLISLIIYNSNTFSILKVALLTSIFYSLITFANLLEIKHLSNTSISDYKTLLFSLFVLLITFLVIFFYKKKNFFGLKNLVLDKSSKFSYFVTLLFFLILFPGIMFLFVGHFKHVDFYALKKINKWTSGPYINNPARLDTAVELQKCDDFILFDLKYPTWTSAIAGKSQFEGNVAFNHFDKKIMQTYESRMTLGVNIENSLLKKQKIQKRFEDELFDIGVVLIITEDQNKFFSDKISMINLKNKDILLLFLRENEKKLFLDNCKPILKI